MSAGVAHTVTVSKEWDSAHVLNVLTAVNGLTKGHIIPYVLIAVDYLNA